MKKSKKAKPVQREPHSLELFDELIARREFDAAAVELQSFQNVVTETFTVPVMVGWLHLDLARGNWVQLQTNCRQFVEQFSKSPAQEHGIRVLAEALRGNGKTAQADKLVNIGALRLIELAKDFRARLDRHRAQQCLCAALRLQPAIRRYIEEAEPALLAVFDGSQN